MRVFNHLRIAGLVAAIITAALLAAGCDQSGGGGGSLVPATDGGGGEFIPVTSIDALSTWPATIPPGVKVNLNSYVTVSPETATVREITWSIAELEELGLTAAGVAGGEFTPTQAGTMTVTAVIKGGGEAKKDFTKDKFTAIAVAAGPPGQGAQGPVIELNVTSAESGIMDKGGTRPFTAEVRVDGEVVTEPPEPVTWVVEGSEAANPEDEPPSSINENGVLTIGPDEAGINLSVKAVYAETESGAVTVKVKGWKKVDLREAVPSISPYGIAYGAGKWVVVGGVSGSPKMAASVDGVEWAEVQITGAVAGGLNNVVYDGPENNKKFIALGKGTILSSSDGETWTANPFAEQGGVNFQFYGAAYGNNMFIATGNGTSTSGKGTGIATSTDGTNWTWVETTPAGLSTVNAYTGTYTIASNGSFFIALFPNYAAIAKTTNVTDMVLVANIVNESNPALTALGYTKTFTEISVSSTPALEDVLYTGSQWIVTGKRNVLIFSEDAVSWTPVLVASDFTAAASMRFARGNGKLVIGGALSGGNTRSIGYTTLPLSEASEWTYSDLPASLGLIRFIGYGNHQFITSNSNGLMMIAHEETLD